MFRKKAIISITTFSLYLLILFSIFVFSYNFYIDSKEDFSYLVKEEEILNCVQLLRDDLISIAKVTNSSIVHNDFSCPDNLVFVLENKNILAKFNFNDNLYESNFSLYGIGFCQNYYFIANSYVVFKNQGNCIKLVTN